MSLDEQLRAGLQRAAEVVRPDQDLTLSEVRRTHHRSLLRRRTLRQAAAVAVAATLFVGVAIFVSWRASPDRYRSTATVRVVSYGTRWSRPTEPSSSSGTRRSTVRSPRPARTTRLSGSLRHRQAFDTYSSHPTERSSSSDNRRDHATRRGTEARRGKRRRTRRPHCCSWGRAGPRSVLGQWIVRAHCRVHDPGR
jgi:hypothetical protein